MKLEINGLLYDVVITRKSIKNMYLRIKEDKKIHISANRFITKSMIEGFIRSNLSTISKELERIERKKKKEKYFNYLGKSYDIVILNTANKIIFDEDKVFIDDENKLYNFLKKESLRIFKERLNICYNLFNNIVPYPKLMIRKMKQKWGYCNKKECLVKLNSELIKYSINEIDYVIIHELCHFLHFNHSASFWKEVKKYKPNYKEAQKVLKEI